MRNDLKKVGVCHVVPKLDVGGMENGIVNLLNNHDRKRFSLMLCCLNEQGAMTGRLKPDVQLVCAGMPEGKRQLLFVPKLARLFLSAGIDVVHVHAWGGGSLYGILAARLAGVPVVVNGEHGLFRTRRHQVIVQRFLARLCDRTLSVGSALKDQIERTLGIPSEYITVIPNGVDTEVFSGQCRVDKFEVLKRSIDLPGNGPKPFVIGSIGSIKPIKNQIMLLKALLKLRKRIPDHPVCVTFVGDGPDRRMLEEFVRGSGLEENVVFLGVRHDVPQLLSQMDLFVSTSLPDVEGMSNVQLEAMSSGAPVVATESIGASELIIDGFNGFIVRCHDIEALSDRIEMLIRNPDLLMEMSTNAKRFIYEHYSLRRMVGRYEDLYLECLGDRKKRGFPVRTN